MPRLGSDSNSSVRRHNPTQTLSNYFQVNSQVWQIRSSGPSRIDAQAHADSSASQPPDPQFDVLDDLLSRTRASGPRTRWNARPFGSPYGHRPLHKWLPSEQKHFEELSALMEMFPEPGSDEEYEDEKDLHEIVAEDLGLEDDEDQVDDEPEEEEDTEEDEEDESEPQAADMAQPTRTPPQPASQPQPSASAAKKREKNKKKKAKARAKAKEKMKPALPPDPVRDPPQDLLVSMSRIAQLVGSLNTDSPEESNEFLQRVRDAFTEEGRRQLGSLKPTSEPAQWRAEVLQSVRRMESMLGQMEKWQAQVAPGEIEALRAETARLEVRVRAVVEQKERERAEVRAGIQAKHTSGTQIVKNPGAPVKAKDEVEVEVAEAAASSEGEEAAVLDGGELFQAGAEQSDDDADSVSDSAAESSSCLSETDTGPTEPEPDDQPSVRDDKSLQADPPPTSLPTTAASPPQVPTRATAVIQPAYSEPIAVPIPSPATLATVPSSSTTPQTDTSTAPAGTDPLTPSTLATPNQNIPPEPPADPVGHLTKNPWTMIEVLFLLEVVAHFPPSEHGWTFIAEAYNNILITRPLQEWFGKQATASNEEEAKMKTVLHKMHTEARQLRSRSAQQDAAKAGGERGKAAPFGSAEARAEANARAKQPANAPGAATAGLDRDALVLTRLPYPLKAAGATTTHPADNPATPPPAQRIVPFPRRRPPLSLPSEDARAFARVMASAVAGVRPPSSESRAAMLALYSATKSRFPVRTAWDCWHRWCTPWVAQEHVEPDPEKPPMVLDYVAGNVCLPAGTWITQAHGFVYRPVPGTYPEVRGVQRRVTAGYDPRPGMVAFARMAHLYAERTWAAMGLKRRPDGTVAEEVLVGRRAKLPGTLAGIWPGKATPPKAARAATQATTAQANSAQPSPTQTSAPAPAEAPAVDSKKVRFAPLPPNRTSNATPAAAAATPTTSTAAASTATPNTIANPRPPFLPLPQPRERPPPEPPRVPEGTLGNRVRPGIAAWFEHATVRADVLERVMNLREARRRFEHAVSGKALREERDGEAERGKNVPLHLRRVIVPPPHPLMLVRPRAQSPMWGAEVDAGR